MKMKENKRAICVYYYIKKIRKLLVRLKRRLKVTKKEAKKQYQLSFLDDPNTREWEKQKIRDRYGIILSLPDDFFEKLNPANNFDKDLCLLVKYIESYINKAKQNRQELNIDPCLWAIYDLWGFFSYFEDDGFWDLSDKHLNEEKDEELIEMRKNLLNALNLVGFISVGKELVNMWKNYHDDYEQLLFLQKKYWDDEFRTQFAIQLYQYIIENKEEIFQLKGVK